MTILNPGGQGLWVAYPIIYTFIQDLRAGDKVLDQVLSCLKGLD